MTPESRPSDLPVAAPTEPERPRVEEVPAPGSPKARLRAKREELRQKKEIDLIVPGYGGVLAVRYRAVKQEDFERLGQRIAQMGADNVTALDAAIDLLTESCVTMLYRDEPDQIFEPLEDDAGKPITYSPALAELLGFEANTAREVVLGVFSPDGVKDLSPLVHGNALSEWMQGNDDRINRSLLGK